MEDKMDKMEIEPAFLWIRHEIYLKNKSLNFFQFKFNLKKVIIVRICYCKIPTVLCVETPQRYLTRNRILNQQVKVFTLKKI